MKTKRRTNRMGQVQSGPGGAGGWIIGVVALFVIGILYSLLATVYAPIFNSAYNVSVSLGADNSTMRTLNVVNRVWSITPLLLVVAVALFIIISSLKREPYDYY